MPQNAPIPFDDTYVQTILEAIRDRHGDLIAADERLSLSGEMSHGHVLAELTLEKRDGSWRYELATVVPLELNDIDTPFEARDVCLDALDDVFAAFLQSERTKRHTSVFSDYAYGIYTIQLRTSISRPDLEAEADRILREAGEL